MGFYLNPHLKPYSYTDFSIQTEFSNNLYMNILKKILLVLAFTNCATNQATFTSTQKWGELEEKFTKTWKPKYVSLSDSDLKALPDDSRFSKESLKKEERYLLSLQSQRTDEDEKIIELQKHVCGFFYDGYRVGFNPGFDDFLMDIYMDARLFGFQGKRYFNRVRPSYIFSSLRPSIENPPHPAYPSNHSIQANLVALVLSDIFPKNKSIIIKAGREIARNRELAGVHYPSDTELGIIIAQMFYEKLNKNSIYRDKIKYFSINSDHFQFRENMFSKNDYKSCKSFTNNYAARKKIW